MADSGSTHPTKRLRYITDWPAPDPREADAVAGFWRREGAIGDERVVAERLPQLVMHVRDGDDIAAVCTARPATPPHFGQPVYLYRTFVGRAWRHTLLVSQLARRAAALLERHAIEHDYPCIGVMVELEAPQFRECLRVPVWGR